MNKKTLISISVAMPVIFLFFMAGCSSTKSGGAVNTSPAAVQKDKGTNPVYRDFSDVLLPGEMEVVQKSSFVHTTPGFAAGVLMLKGYVDNESLISFFQNNMAKDNWKLISFFKSPKTKMLFRKETRFSVISITEETFYTYAEVWVSPSIGELDTRLLK